MVIFLSIVCIWIYLSGILLMYLSDGELQPFWLTIFHPITIPGFVIVGSILNGWDSLCDSINVNCGQIIEIDNIRD